MPSFPAHSPFAKLLRTGPRNVSQESGMIPSRFSSIRASIATLFRPAHPAEQGLHVGPELFPLRAFLVRQMGECVLVPDAGQVGIALRVLQPLPGGDARRTLFELLAPPRE